MGVRCGPAHELHKLRGNIPCRQCGEKALSENVLQG